MDWYSRYEIQTALVSDELDVTGTFTELSDDDDDESGDDGSSFDLLKMIMQQAESMSDVSPIEMMEDYGDTELEVTLEELIQYNNNLRKKNS